ncbi:Hypothetical predicted protein [Podarcis lilfordi]|uniref:Uncharacterized protein n=1 Tax=Podarcis lilfordi TaxID=74358 RepID=A0AA35KNE9_9SAUR|nr:Hypothetical predicted protein [Podarcis lilfordi]
MLMTIGVETPESFKEEPPTIYFIIFISTICHLIFRILKWVAEARDPAKFFASGFDRCRCIYFLVPVKDSHVPRKVPIAFGTMQYLLLITHPTVLYLHTP